MLSALLVDDETASRKTLSGFMQKYCPDVIVAGEASSVAEAATMVLKLSPALVFLDINMPGENGFELFRKVPEPTFHTIFVTAHDEYALKAIKHHALDYILKPVNISELIDAVQRGKQMYESQNTSGQASSILQCIHQIKLPEKIALPVADGLLYVYIHNIIRCEAEGSYTIFYFSDRHKLVVSRPLGTYETQLKTHGFIRIHNQHLINLAHVEKYQRGRGGLVTMSDNQEVMVSQRKKDEFLKLIGNSGHGDHLL